MTSLAFFTLLMFKDVLFDRLQEMKGGKLLIGNIIKGARPPWPALVTAAPGSFYPHSRSIVISEIDKSQGKTVAEPSAQYGRESMKMAQRISEGCDVLR